MKIIFFGSSKYSTIDEQALFDAFGLSLIVTTPDQKDKKDSLTPNPVKKFALEHNVPIVTTDKITEENLEEIKKYQPDFLVTADIRLILPEKLLTTPKIAAINVHHSLLPKFRGPAPVPFTILSGETTTAVSIILIAKKVDAGDILAQEKYEMTPTDTTDSVLTKLNQLGGELAVKVIQNFDEYFSKRQKQDESQATYSHFMTRDDGFIELEKPFDSLRLLREKFFGERSRTILDFSTQLDLMIRAYFPWPGVWTYAMINDKRLRIKFLPSSSHPELVSGSKSFLIQIEGKKPMNYKDFINGYKEGKEILQKLQLL